MEERRRRRLRRPEVGVGSILGRSFSVWFRNFVPFTVLMVLVQSPLIVYAYFTFSGELTIKGLERWGWVQYGGSFVLNVVAAGAVSYGVFRQLRDERAGIGDCIAVGVRNLLPVIGVGLVAGLIAIVPLLPIFFGELAAALLSLALYIPAIVLACMLWVAVPVAVVERPGVLRSLKRSVYLTNGAKGTIFGVLILLGIISIAVNQAIEIVIPPEDKVKTYLWATFGASLVFGTLNAVAPAVGYHDLRRSKEGIGIDELVRVFE